MNKPHPSRETVASEFSITGQSALGWRSFPRRRLNQPAVAQEVVYGCFPALHFAPEPLRCVTVEPGVPSRRKSGVEIANACPRLAAGSKVQRDPDLRRDHAGLDPGKGNRERCGIV